MNINVPILDKGYKVLVKCPTYNHSKFICDALNGFSIQETNFPFICIVVDDASKDGNQDVIKQYANENCDMSNAEISEDDISTYIRVSHKTNSNCDFLFCLLKVNLYCKPEKQEIYKPYRAVCEYEAICEGDDYWIYQKKLQMQVVYLDSHPECGLVYAKSKVFVQQNNRFRRNCIGSDVSDIKKLIFRNDICTLTTCFRQSYMKDYILDPEIIKKSREWKLGDYPMWLWIVCQYSAHFIDTEVSVYRILNESISHSNDIRKVIAYNQSVLDIRHFFIKKFNLPKELYDLVNEEYNGRMGLCYLMTHNYKSAIDCMKILSLENKIKIIREYTKNIISNFLSR